MIEILRGGRVRQRGVLECAEREKKTHIVLETAIPAPEIAFFKVIDALDLASE
jgi:hypothetical protein